MDYENKSHENRRSFRVGFLCGGLICLLAVSAIYGGKNLYEYSKLRFTQSTNANTPIQEGASVVNSATIQKLSTIENLIAENYYKTDVTEEQLETGIYKGMVAALGDPYAEYYSADELNIAYSNLEGVTYGIGAYISYDEKMETAVISGIIEGGSAEEIGLREGDCIISVDGVDVQGFSSAQVVALVRGQENTVVHLSLYREGEPDLLEYDLVRKKALEKNTVSYAVLEDGVGYLRISEFDDITLDQFAEGMAVLNENEIKGLILDLRSNPGGNVSTVTEIARKILPKGLIVYTEDRSGKREEYTCDGSNELQIPLVVLINQYSASASEILAGAIQDYEKGTLIGMTTYGKGVVQRIISLSDGTAVKLTVSSYYTPMGRNLGGVGVTPDIELDLDRVAYYEEGVDNQFDKAVETVKELMEN